MQGVQTLNKQPGKRKFDQRGRECIFFGYLEESKGNRVWLSVERKIQVTRDANFMNEHLTRLGGRDFPSERTFLEMVEKQLRENR